MKVACDEADKPPTRSPRDPRASNRNQFAVRESAAKMPGINPSAVVAFYHNLIVLNLVAAGGAPLRKPMVKWYPRTIFNIGVSVTILP
eukprot:SAG11_NODE_108_length_16386_cov_20.828329_14_plen_88_part_00